MKIVRLGNSDLNVSSLCLGTMTFGQQNNEQDAHSQLDCALAHGINFIDTAEMYPVPAKPETQGSTETYIGNWLQHQARDQIILASKVAGPNRGMNWVRGGQTLALTAEQINSAIEGSLKRLKTDYLDLYQLHWPERYVPMFGETEYDPSREVPATAIATQIETMAALIKAGKIRHYGLSNETPWGLMQFVNTAEQLGLPKPVSVQNAYNLINRTFEIGLTEVSRHTNIPLLAYSPLAFGILSGKYVNATPADARMTLFPGFGARYHKTNVQEASAAYAQLAKDHGISSSQLALAFVQSRWFVGSTILGATSVAQLEEDIGSDTISLSPELLQAIQGIHRMYCNPGM